eukprot:m.87211 g.87211  ORF g.87211 m.87211 type:complete len:170 (+) comp26046_c0_seq1:59-568(+)
MGVYHCELCNETLFGETFSCETCCDDGHVLCEGCAGTHCASESDKEQGSIHADTALLSTLSGFGVYTDTGKFAHEKSLQSDTVREILSLIIENDSRLQELLPAFREVFSKTRSTTGGTPQPPTSNPPEEVSSSSAASTSSSSSSSSDQPKKKAKISDSAEVIHINLTCT